MKSFLEYRLLPFLIKALISTLKIKITNRDALNKPAVFIFWHSQMLAGWSIFRNRKSCALVSQSKDGEILSALLKKWNYKVSRGSSSKGGKEALRDLINASHEDYSIVITPDGPRGPAEQIKNGALIVANECSIPIIPVKIIYSSKKILLKSWDKFQIPYPFSKCTVIFGNEYFYPEYLDEVKLTEFKNKLASEL
ncbi:MAG: lysophospholipid acyltransferase family protein [Ignavibacteria bacterium]|nr:lysophospholipid acyltransferase family protein [Ignavibacteria bacterium]